MQLISILLITVSILTILSGLAIFLGASKGDRVRSAWFFVATIFALIWTVSIVLFLTSTPNTGGEIHLYIKATYLSAVYIDVALLGYIVWKQKYGKFLTFGFLIAGIILSAVFLYNPSLLYTDVILSAAGNGLATNIGPFYFIYIAFFSCLVPTVLIVLLRQILKTTSKRRRGGDIVLMIGFAISGTAALIFNLILPLSRWDLIWLGPLAISTTIIAFYYAILRYRSLNLSSIWLRILSYIVLITSAAVIYMVIFFLIFMAMFKGAVPSTEVIILNFIMIAIVLLLLPAMNEVTMFMRSLISIQQIDMVYIIKKLSHAAPKGVDLKEMAAFLADHMHFEYIGFLVDGEVYGSTQRNISDTGIKMIAGLGNPERGVWQEFDESTVVWQKLDLAAVAALRDANGKTFGQVMVGKPINRVSFSRRDLIQVETIINLVSVIIDSKRRKKS